MRKLEWQHDALRYDVMDVETADRMLLALFERTLQTYNENGITEGSCVELK